MPIMTASTGPRGANSMKLSAAESSIQRTPSGTRGSSPRTRPHHPCAGRPRRSCPRRCRGHHHDGRHHGEQGEGSSMAPALTALKTRTSRDEAGVSALMAHLGGRFWVHIHLPNARNEAARRLLKAERRLGRDLTRPFGSVRQIAPSWGGQQGAILTMMSLTATSGWAAHRGGTRF